MSLGKTHSRGGGHIIASGKFTCGAVRYRSPTVGPLILIDCTAKLKLFM